MIKTQFVLEAAKHINIDISKLSKLLTWREFEDLISNICKKNDFTTILNYRFSDKSDFVRKTNQKRYEIDVIAESKDIILLIDAKHWNGKTSNRSSVLKAYDLQKRRIQALLKNEESVYKLVSRLLPPHKLREIKNFLPLKLVPLVVTLNDEIYRVTDEQIPIVPIFNLNGFIQELDSNLNYNYYEEIYRFKTQKTLLDKY